MNKLQQAYIDLGLQPGAPLGDVMERWRRVARMWHPDRASSEDERTIAEAELKKVNGARDLIARHYQDGLHRLVACECAVPAAAPEPSQQQQAPGTSGRTATNGSAAKHGSRKHRRRQTSPSGLAAIVTIAMVLFGMFIVKMNSGVRLRNGGDAYESSANAAYWRGTDGRSAVRQSTISSLRPSPATAVEASLAAANEQRAKAEVAAAQRKIAELKDRERQKAKETQLPPNTSAITFVSSDGRLVSLQDGTTWELWGQEAADSMFQWDKGDRVTVKGLESNPSWLVNETHGYQAVKVTAVR